MSLLRRSRWWRCWLVRRSLRAAEPSAFAVAWAPHGREWLELVRYWAGGGRGTAWFLANPRRTNLDLIDPHSRRDVVRYRWGVEHRTELSGTRPAAVDWYRFRPPGWFAGEGWSLSPEVGGLTQADRAGPDRRPIVAYVRHHTGAMHAFIGGRYLANASDPEAEIEVSVAGRILDRWRAGPSLQTFLRPIDLPGGIPAPEAGYAMVTISARPAVASARPLAPVAIRQFDVQPVARAIVGYGEGWHDEEYDAGSGTRWRWTSDRAVVHVRAVTGVRVRVRGDSPLRDFSAPPTVTISAGGREVARLEPRDRWTCDAIVAADLLAASNGEVVIATSQVFTPSEIRGSPDTRRLGLRIFALDVESVR
jgi:hypothetical protein